MKIKKGFTFIEILVVMAVLVVLAAIVMLILNPSEYLRRARDAQRLGDAARINQAMALYNFGSASQANNQDGDGPRFPTTGSPPTTDSCITDPNQRIFVSVPSDNGESNPTPPSGWSYSRVSSTKLRAIDGSGWLPVNFMDAQTSQTPFSVLPVDPVNTFASGYYYSYGCGSWNVNMRFESEKYQELATKDQGRFSGVYEIGSDLAVLPEQERYGTSTYGGSVSGPAFLFPSVNAGGGWTGSFGAIADSNSTTPDDSSLIYSTASPGQYGASSTYLMNGDYSPIGIIDKVTVKVRASQIGYPPTSYILQLRVKKSGTKADLPINGLNSITPLTASYVTYSTDLLTNPLTGSSWQWTDLPSLELGPVITQKGSSGSAQVSHLYLIVEYH